MSDRRTFMGQLAAGAAGMAASALPASAGSWAPTTASASASSAVARAARRSSRPPSAVPTSKPSPWPTSIPGAWTRYAPSSRHQDLPRRPPVAGRQEHRRRAHRHSAAPARAAFRDGHARRKDTYQEKTMAFTPNHARRMRKAFEGSGRVVQIGMQMISGAGFLKVRELATPERMGTLTALQTFHFRNAPYGGWLRELPPDCDEQHVDWPPSKARPSTTLRSDALLQLALLLGLLRRQHVREHDPPGRFWFGALDLGIPLSVTTAAANFRSPKMQVPDTMNVNMHMARSSCSLEFDVRQRLLRRDAGPAIRLRRHYHSHPVRQGRIPPAGRQRRRQRTVADNEGYREITDDHMQNFFDCVRSRQQPHAPSSSVSAPPSPCRWRRFLSPRHHRALGSGQRRNRLILF